ncbi:MULTISPECIES: AraC family transcriptional regulator [Clostridium]|uniref:AraC family transcriptional regulator n=1 Tax=Clostridium frigoriphilum TaxID=443253 RepID=A0ABU7UUM9_9CLOT|nr:AraC family transcriptional regulator [Clostridium sp. DSM 17811]MBU3102169.1 AraC family transcriptional regulator [Clostridium sp. DSM 17811]
MDYIHEIVKIEEQMPIKIYIQKLSTFFIEKHWHSDVELTYIISGKIDMVNIDGVKYTAKKDDIFLINSNTIHSFFVAHVETKTVTLLIPYEFIKKTYPEIGTKFFNCMCFSNANNEKKFPFDDLRTILDQITEFYDKEQLFWNIKLTSLSYELIYFLLKNFTQNRTESEIITNNENLEKISIICNYIKNHYKKSLSVNKIASIYSYSPEYLCRYFKKHMGMTIHKYIDTIRLMNSHRDLLNTDYSITRIALENGFPNEKSFTRVFKSIYEETPDKYRKKLLNKNCLESQK